MQEELQNISNFFNLGEIKHSEKAGGSNANFFVSTNKGEYLVKTFSKDRAIEPIHQEQEFLQRLTNNNFKFIPYLRNKDDELIFSNQICLALAQEKVDAVAPDSLTPQMISPLGVELAKLHLIPYQGLSDKKSWLQRDDLKNGVNILKDKYIETDEIKKLVALYEQSNVDWSKLPQAIIHADLFMDNTLFCGEEFVSLIDWEEVTVNAAVLDFAMGVVGCCFSNDQFDLALYGAFYAAYNKIRPFTVEEVEILDQAVRFTGLTRAVWKFLHDNHFKPESKINEGYKLFWKEGLDKWVVPNDI